MDKRRYKLKLSYDGGNFHGWQIQHGLPTIQGTVESALERLFGHEIRLLGSGRTDAGVHAIQQVATFSTTVERSPETVTKALNAMLPETIRIRSTEPVPLAFHPIHDIVAKRYRYLIDDSRPPWPFLRRYCWIHRKPLDVERMNAAARHLLGTHDFACFQTTGSPRESTVRTISDIFVTRRENPGPWNDVLPVSPPGAHSLVVLEVEADGFLYNMVRAITGTLALIGAGQGAHPKSRGFGMPPEAIRGMLDSKDRSLAGATAPPQGLYMLDVRY